MGYSLYYYALAQHEVFYFCVNFILCGRACTQQHQQQIAHITARCSFNCAKRVARSFQTLERRRVTTMRRNNSNFNAFSAIRINKLCSKQQQCSSKCVHCTHTQLCSMCCRHDADDAPTMSTPTTHANVLHLTACSIYCSKTTCTQRAHPCPELCGRTPPSCCERRTRVVMCYALCVCVCCLTG